MAALNYGHFFGDEVVSFSSDGSLDFLKGEPSLTPPFKLTRPQLEYLERAGVKRRIIFPRQVHGDAILDVTSGDLALTGEAEADAIVTAEEGLAVAVRTADCLPLLLFVPGRRVVAAVHAGWKSTRLDIAAKTVALMKKKYNIDPAAIKAVIGPCIRPASYPVGIDFKNFFPQEVAGRDGCFYFDIAAANRRQLLGEGVRPGNIFDCSCDTYADKTWHSFRRDGEVSGRMIHVIMMKEMA